MMEIPEHIVADFVKGTVQIRDIWEIQMSQEDGITPKGGYDSRIKYFVVLGLDDEGNVYGGVVINSNINPRIPSAIRDYYMPIHKADYPFLRYDSFIDCSTLKTARLEKLCAGQKLGEITPTDYDWVVGTIIESPFEKQANLRKFGLVSRR